MGGWSLGWERRHGYANYEWFSHGGANTGIGGYIYATMEDGKGITFFGNGPNRVRFPVLDQLRNSIIESHEWYRPMEGVQLTDLSEEDRNRLVGRYTDLIFGQEINISEANGKLFISPFAGGGRNELMYVGNNTFVIDEFTSVLGYEYDEKDNNIYLTLTRNGIQDSRERLLKKLEDTIYEVTFRLTVPDAGDEVFIAGNQDALGNWDPGLVKLEKTSEYERTIKLKLRLPVQYKFTRGSWETEGAVEGQLGRDNLRLDSVTGDEVRYTIESWLDR